MVTSHTLLLTLALAAPGDTVLLQFSADWCGPCRAMEPVVRRLESSGYSVRRINTDQSPELASRFGITAVPSFVMLANGREVDRVVGGASYDRLLRMYEKAGTTRTTPEVRGQSPDRPRLLELPRPRKRLKREQNTTAAVGAQPAPPGDPFAAQAAVASAPSHQPPTGGAEVIQRTLAATVRIKVDDAQGHSYGTGTIIDTHGSEALVVTCGHIFRDSNGQGAIWVDMFRPPERRGLSATLIHYDLDRDIGFISFAPGVAVQPVRVAPARFPIRPGADVFSIGCNHGNPPTVRRSQITAVDKYLGPPNIEVAGQPVDGRSGGGLFTRDGWLIGICNAADPADNEGIFAALASVQGELDRIGQRQIYAASPAAAVTPSPDAEWEGHPADLQPASTSAPPLAVASAQHIPSAEDTEIICIIRSRDPAAGPGRLLILEQPSADFLQQLRQESTLPADALVPVDAAATALSGIANSPSEPLVRAQSLDH